MLVIAKCWGITRLKVIDVWWMISQNWLNVLHDLQRKWLQITDSQIRDEEIPVILLYNTPLAMPNNTRCRGRGCWHLVVGRGRLLSILQRTGPSLPNRHVPSQSVLKLRNPGQTMVLGAEMVMGETGRCGLEWMTQADNTRTHVPSRCHTCRKHSSPTLCPLL